VGTNLKLQYSICTYSFRNSAVRLFVTPYLDPAPADVRTIYLPRYSSCHRKVVDDAWRRVVPPVATDDSSQSMAVIMDTDFRMYEAFW